MPYLRILTNRPIDTGQQHQIIASASKLIAETLGKAERYVMVGFAPPEPMVFAGTDAPCAYLELKSIGLPQERTAELSGSLCDLMEKSIAVPADRVYIEFTDAQRSMWGWNGATF